MLQSIIKIQTNSQLSESAHVNCQYSFLRRRLDGGKMFGQPSLLRMPKAVSK